MTDRNDRNDGDDDRFAGWRPAEGVRIIGAAEAREVLDSGRAAGRRPDDPPPFASGGGDHVPSPPARLHPVQPVSRFDAVEAPEDRGPVSSEDADPTGSLEVAAPSPPASPLPSSAPQSLSARSQPAWAPPTLAASAGGTSGPSTLVAPTAYESGEPEAADLVLARRPAVDDLEVLDDDEPAPARNSSEGPMAEPAANPPYPAPLDPASDQGGSDRGRSDPPAPDPSGPDTVGPSSPEPAWARADTEAFVFAPPAGIAAPEVEEPVVSEEPSVFDAPVEPIVSEEPVVSEERTGFDAPVDLEDSVVSEDSGRGDTFARVDSGSEGGADDAQPIAAAAATETAGRNRPSMRRGATAVRARFARRLPDPDGTVEQEAKPVGQEAELIGLAEAEPVGLAEAEPVGMTEAEPVGMADPDGAAGAGPEPDGLVEPEPIVARSTRTARAPRTRPALRNPAPTPDDAAVGVRTDDEPPSKRGQDIGSRLVIGVGLVALLAVAYAVGAKALVVLAAVVVLFCAAEAYRMLQRCGFRPATLLGLTATGGVMFAAYWRGEPAVPLVMAVAFAATMVWYLIGIVDARPLANVAVTSMTVLWVGLLGSFAALMLRQHDGKGLFLGAVVVTVAADVAAYFGGRRWGHHLLAPRVSPGKTVEGFIAGAAAAVIAGIIVGEAVHPWGGLVHGVLLGVAVALFAPVGDLFESLIKRDLEVKDSGTILAGHGGLLDRFDSLLLVLPVTYYLADYLHLVR